MIKFIILIVKYNISAHGLDFYIYFFTLRLLHREFQIKFCLEQNCEIKFQYSFVMISTSWLIKSIIQYLIECLRKERDQINNKV